ncbi:MULTISPECIES: protein translocase subunit SecF [Clostridium]|jgi:preprotein translocase SecF subunit|uniref:Protein-export membrane protein SecF n=1 Tax=Clostridium intestinale URNW TaxID=1294142 RepID=U2NPZ3_9CLOT|nr:MULTISPECIES: protein translocase subunit SecF [Clostridium]ERK30926.1 protein export protein SecD [Clostridium intestinale URNW]
MLKIIEKTKIWFSISLLVIVLGIGFMVYRGGLNFGIDFIGGSKVIIQMPDDFTKSEVDEIIKKYAEDAVTNTVNDTQLEVKAKDFDSTKVSEMMNELKEKYKLEDDALVSQDEIGASVSSELTKNSLISLSIAVIAMLIYVAVRFEFKFGVSAIIALLHDILITVAIYAIFNVPVNTPFIVAILTIVGYSINDTIVIFDRIRENINKMRRSSPAEVANISVTQTMSRSINTTLTTLFTIIAVNVFVPSVREFTFPLIIGIACGAYSSIFIASPVWVMLKNRK